MPRLVLFWLLLLPAVAEAAPLPIKLRQMIICAPEWDVITWAADPAVTDAELANRLWAAVREGRARLVSDLTGAVEDGRAMSLSSGHPIWLPTEVDQEFDQLFMMPINHEEFPVGSSLECNKPVLSKAPDPESLRFSSDFRIRFSPRGPATVRWPTSWLNIHDGTKYTGKAIHGWLDWHDLFEENVAGRLALPSAEPALMAILPPADQLWPAEPVENGRWLDVFMAQMVAAGSGTASGKASAHRPRTLLLGIALPSEEARQLLAERDPAEDAALFSGLLDRARSGAARLIFTAASADSGATLSSGRRHNFPTEMPSIPSAWEERPVGTRWECDGSQITLGQDLAPPARTQWSLARDLPDVIMWEPRFRGFSLELSQVEGSGACLLSAIHIPDVMRGPGLDADESIFVFARRQAPPRLAPAATADPFAPAAAPISPVQDYEAEMIVFEVPAQEESAWQPAGFGDATEPDKVRLETLMKRAAAGSAKLAAQMLLRLPQNTERHCRVVEEYLTAQEFDPPRLPNSPRMRPTGLDMLPVGTRWKITVAGTAPDNSNAVVVYGVFENSTAKPVEPSLAETLAIAARGSFHYPGAIHHQETWECNATVPLGQALCLGTRTPPGLAGHVRHVAFMRVRKL